MNEAESNKLAGAIILQQNNDNYTEKNLGGKKMFYIFSFFQDLFILWMTECSA